MKTHLAALSAAVLFSASFLHAESSASTLLAQGHVDEVIAQLTPAKDAAAPGNSAYFRWLGEAYGLKASKSGKLSAFGLAKKASAAWEKALQLDPKNADALSDLGDFSVDAPAMVGGGIDRAKSIAPRLIAVSPPRGHRLLARIAEKQNDISGAEKEYIAAATGAHAAAGYVDLAGFYKRHGSKNQVLSAVKSAVAADPSRDYSVSDAAGTLIEAGLDAKFAQHLYRSYLDGPSRSEGAPPCRVYTELARNLAATGDTAGAKAAFAAALALAKNYAPAQKAAGR